MENKKTYRVYFIRTLEYYIDIEAETKEEAQKLWEHEDLFNEETTGNGNTEITEVEEIKEDIPTIGIYRISN